MTLPLSPHRVSPMEARSADALPAGKWQFEPKWDGFRCLAFKDGPRISLMAKSGKQLTRYFPEIAAALANLPGDWVLDGELVIAVGKFLSFGALQMRLHPAESRIRKLAAESPAILIVFDLLAAHGADYTGKPLAVRRPALERLMAGFGPASRLRLSPFTRSR